MGNRKKSDINFGLIVAAGAIDDYAAHRNILTTLPAPDRIYCADGGLRHAAQLGITPDLILGDFDSADPGMLEQYKISGAPFETHPADKDFTDTELAAERAVLDGCGVILVFGAFGARIDHAYTNLQMLYKFASRGVRMALADSYGAAAVLLPGAELRIDAREPVASLLGYGESETLRAANDGAGAVFKDLKISLLPIGGPARGVRASGLKYKLDGADFEKFYTSGVSNEFTGNTASIELGEGALLVMICPGG